LFGGRKSLAKELASDSEKSRKQRISFFNKLVKLYPAKEEKVKYFSYKNIDNALKNPAELLSVLQKIEEMILSEIVDIEGEEKLDSEIIRDLKKLSSTESNSKTISLLKSIGDGEDVQENVLKIFRKLHEVLSTELHTIQLIKNNPKNIKELLLNLFGLIFHQEAHLHKTFMPDTFSNDEITLKVKNIAKAVLLEEELEEEELKTDEKFIRSMARTMGNEYSEHHYRKLAEDIYTDLLDEAGAPFSDFDEADIGLKKVEAIVNDDARLLKIIKENVPKYSEEKLRQVMIAFRKAYSPASFGWY
jgi:hypothetical protein